MKILTQASSVERQRLLELFPVANLKAAFPFKGSKEKSCSSAAADASKPNIEKIAAFVDANLNVCKQHVHIFSHIGDASLPEDIISGERVVSDGSHALYLVRLKYDVVLFGPPEERSIEFLWPICIELTKRYLIAKFVVLEKNMSSYFDRQLSVRGKSIDEDTVAESLRATGTLSVADLNRGIKKLWHDDIIDSPRTKYKTTISTDSVAMDEERGIKRYNPKLYDALQNAPLYSTPFRVLNEQSAIKAFTSDPTNGMIGFTTYAKEGKDTDAIIRQILESN